MYMLNRDIYLIESKVCDMNDEEDEGAFLFSSPEKSFKLWAKNDTTKVNILHFLFTLHNLLMRNQR